MSNKEIDKTDSEIQKDALDAIARICKSKRNDSIDDIICEVNRSKRRISEKPADTDWKKEYANAQYRLDFIKSLCESKTNFPALPQHTRNFACEVFRICNEPIKI